MLPARACECGGNAEHTCMFDTVYAMSRIGSITTTTNDIAQYVIVTLINEKTMHAACRGTLKFHRNNVSPSGTHHRTEQAKDYESLAWDDSNEICCQDIRDETLGDRKHVSEISRCTGRMTRTEIPMGTSRTAACSGFNSCTSWKNRGMK